MLEAQILFNDASGHCHVKRTGLIITDESSSCRNLVHDIHKHHNNTTCKKISSTIYLSVNSDVCEEVK